MRARETSADTAARFLEMRAERTMRDTLDALRQAIVTATSPEALAGKWPWDREAVPETAGVLAKRSRKART